MNDIRQSVQCSRRVVVFFKQKTAYEMRISDWSSDVCSSDLAFLKGNQQVETARRGRGGDAAEQREIKGVDRAAVLAGAADGDKRDRLAALEAERRGVAVDDIEIGRAHV